MRIGIRLRLPRRRMPRMLRRRMVYRLSGEDGVGAGAPHGDLPLARVTFGSRKALSLFEDVLLL